MKKGIRRAIALLIVLIIISGMGYVAYKRYGEKIKMVALKKKKESINVATPVAVSTARLGDIQKVLSLTGRIEPESEVNIFSTVPGKVKEILVSEGERVKKDQVLLYIDRSEAGLVYAPTPVKSTISGIIKLVMVKIGAYIVPQTPLVKVINIESVDMDIKVPERDTKLVKAGMVGKVELIAFPEKTFTGRVYKVSPVIDPLTGTLDVKLRIKNPGRIIKPGMFGSVELIAEEHKGTVIIPVAAILNREGKNAVFIAGKDGKAVIRFPVFGIKRGEKIEVLKGVEPGEKVVVIGQYNLSAGDRINVTEELE